MKTSRRWLIFLFWATISVTLGATGLLSATPATAQGESNVHFQWAFGAIKNTDGGQKFESVTRDTVLKSGDQIKFFINLKKKCFLYVIYYSSQKELSVLFPFRFKAQDLAPQPIYIPKGNEWFELDDHTGREKFYLLGSAERLADLEILVNKYESADKAKKQEFATQVLAEIRRLRKQHLKLKSSAERPVTIIGNMRGSGNKEVSGKYDVADFAVEISADNFFSRTFTIGHQ